jgi:para-aminobenzoate synthetase component I
MNKEEAIQKMNIMGLKRLPFLFIIDFSMNNPLVLSPVEAFANDILFDFNGSKNYTTCPPFLPVKIIDSTPVKYSMYEKAFSYVQQQLSLGNTFLVNLTFPTPIKTNCTLRDIFHFSKAKYRLLADDHFVVFSPEPFIQIKNGHISTFPMKGTIDASLPGALQLILNDKKEMAEHATIVDLLRNDLSCVADKVNVEKYRYAEEIILGDKRLIQISSMITGELQTDYFSNLGNILFEMLPAGSVTGAPKKKTLEIIAEAENYDRGYYTGVAGYFDGENLDSCVLIRFVEKNGDQLYYKSGGGITSQSLPHDEYQELINKIYVPIG